MGKLTQRWKDFVANKRGNIGGGELAVLIVVVGIGLIIALALIRPVADTVATATGDTNLTSTHTSLLNLVPTVFIAGLVLLILAALFFSGALSKVLGSASGKRRK